MLYDTFARACHMVLNGAFGDNQRQEDLGTATLKGMYETLNSGEVAQIGLFIGCENRALKDLSLARSDREIEYLRETFNRLRG